MDNPIWTSYMPIFGACCHHLEDKCNMGLFALHAYRPCIDVNLSLHPNQCSNGAIFFRESSRIQYRCVLFVLKITSQSRTHGHFLLRMVSQIGKIYFLPWTVSQICRWSCFPRKCLTDTCNCFKCLTVYFLLRIVSHTDTCSFFQEQPLS